MIKVQPIELLVPARDVKCGMEAVKHGADAVYIGAPRFGARAAACNSLEDIDRLVKFAHIYNVRIYVAINVILKDEELLEVKSLIDELYHMGVDALIVQDMALLQLNLPPIPLHASTQMDNRTIDKVDFLSKVGFRQVVLARELSLSQIKQMHEACPDVALEAFVHGALCVSYSGQCYASQACFGRSANRGECAQFCRLNFDMVDADEKIIVKGKHLLSLKDMNRSDRLEEMMDAGITSFKIEGRLKDVSYVKNVTAYYREKLDAVFSRRREYARSSSGNSTYMFTPQLDKSFNRGFTHYFLDGRGEDVLSSDTPKSIGEPMGMVKESYGSCIVVAGIKSFHNGDCICYLDDRRHLQGLRVSKVDSNHLYFRDHTTYIRPHTLIYRNYDREFERILFNESAVRKITVHIVLSEFSNGFIGTMTDEDGHHITLELPVSKEEAHSAQKERLQKELGKLGNTPFTAERIDISMSKNLFIPISAVSDLRRRLVDGLIKVRRICYKQEIAVLKPNVYPFPKNRLTYLGNVMNETASCFYRMHGVTQIDPAFERQGALRPVPVMFCRHCLQYSMGWCLRYQSQKSPYKEPYYLILSDGRRFQLDFDCKKCQMKVLAL